jgi:hypothetical protein
VQLGKTSFLHSAEQWHVLMENKTNNIIDFFDSFWFIPYDKFNEKKISIAQVNLGWRPEPDEAEF